MRRGLPLQKLKHFYCFFKMVSTTLKIGKLTFQLVEYTELTPRQRYVIRITGGPHDCYVGGKFLEYHHNSSRFIIRELYGRAMGLRSFTEYECYYALVPKKQIAQRSMEQRSLQMILQNLIPYFTEIVNLL